jgi:hypothetical protein
MMDGEWILTIGPFIRFFRRNRFAYSQTPAPRVLARAVRS